MIAPWPPTRFTEPLSAEHDSLFARYQAAFRIAWQMAFGYTLETWQEALLHAVTELRPDGRLRFRQVLVSMGRQNGKTEIGAALALLWLLWKADALVIGIASSAEQARLVYERVSKVIGRNAAFARRFDRLTDTRGLSTKSGGRYELKASKSAALQGLPIDLGVVDEVHLLKAALWNDLVNGTGDRPDCLVAGITTAGDDDSELLKHLYAVEAETFGRFIWEAPEATVPGDDDVLGAYLRAANPAIASGRRDVEVAVADARTQPPADVVRYRMNRFTAAKAAFIPADVWQAAQRAETEAFPDARPVVAIDRSPDWGAATLTVSAKVDGITWTEVACSMVRPTMDRLVHACMAMAKHSPTLFIMDGYALRDLGQELIKRGLNVRIATQGDVVTASSLFYAKTIQRKLRHTGDLTLANQVPRTVRKNVGESFRISRADSSTEIDAVMATALGVLGAELDTGATEMLFV